VSPETDSRAQDAGRPDPDGEQEVDLGHYWWRIVGHWWVVVGAVVLGALVGYLVSLGGGTAYQAKATVYLGQPLTPTGNAQIQSLQTNPSTVSQIVKSQSVVAAVASQVGVPPGELRNGISTKAVAGSLSKVGQTQLVEISVRGPWKRQSAEAANALAETVVDRVSGYADTKIEQFTLLLDSLGEQIAASDEAIQSYRDAIAAGTGLSSAERLVLVGLLQTEQQARSQLVEQRTSTELERAVAEDVERGQVVTRAASSKVAAKSKQSSIVVGAVVGLVVGILAALLWEPARRRMARST
jgi:capsular polysaccharide biosynthesis protein